MSPQKFNVSMKIVLDELNEREVQVKWSVALKYMALIQHLAFADDMVNSLESAVSKTIEYFSKMGLDNNF